MIRASLQKLAGRLTSRCGWISLRQWFGQRADGLMFLVHGPAQALRKFVAGSCARGSDRHEEGRRLPVASLRNAASLKMVGGQKG